MIETLFQNQIKIQEHISAPLLEERERRCDRAFCQSIKYSP